MSYVLFFSLFYKDELKFEFKSIKFPQNKSTILRLERTLVKMNTELKHHTKSTALDTILFWWDFRQNLESK